jgi:hypothetical protein
MAESDKVLIRLPNGAEYVIQEDQFATGDVDGQGHSYEDLGATIVRYQNGEPYPREPAPAAPAAPAPPAPPPEPPAAP